jgi:hypothetical protein
MRASVVEQEKIEEYNKMLQDGNISEDEYKVKISSLSKEIRLHWNKDFLEHLDEYNEYKSLLSKVKKQQKTIANLQKSEIVIEILMQGFSNALTLISNRIKNALVYAPTVKTILQGIVELEYTKEVLSSPYDENNVSGMYQHLFQTFHKANFVSFNNELIDVNQWCLSLEESNNNPMKGVNDIQKMAGIWAKLGYLEYMTPDIFWTSRLLSGLHVRSTLRSKAIVEINQFLRKKEIGEIENESVIGELGQYPILRHLCEWIRLLQDSTRLKTPNRSTETSHSGGKVEGNLETAAVATGHVTQGSSMTGASSQSYENLPKFVTRKMFIQITTKKGFTFFYTATSEPCKQCLEQNEKHKPGCYLGQCGRCKLYGHTKANCKSKIDEGRVGETIA